MVFILAISVVACEDYTPSDDTDDEDEAIARTMTVPNGTFYDVSDSNDEEDYLKTVVTGWTATKGSLLTGAVGVSMGIVDMNNTAGFENFKDNIITSKTSFDNPGIDPETPFDTDDEGKATDVRQDTNALLIASVDNEGSLYYKTSSSISLEADKYYKLTYSVCTNIESTDEDKNNKGAWVEISGGLYYVDDCINTNGKWETHTLYIKSNIKETKKIDIRLWLGHGPETITSYDDVQNKTVTVSNPYLVKGAVLFDNIICEEVEKDEAEANKENENTAFESMYYLTNADLDESVLSEPQSSYAKNFYYSAREGLYSSNNVNGFDMQKGKKDLTTDRPTVNTPTTGIFDLSKLYNSDGEDLYRSLLSNSASSYSNKWVNTSYENWKKYLMGDDGNRQMSALDETKALIIALNDLSGVGFTSTQAINIESNKYYKISIWTYVYALSALPDTSDKPEEPKAYTDWQSAVLAAKADELKYELPSNYFDALTDAENDKLEDYDSANDNAASVIAYLEWLADTQSAYRKNDSGIDDTEKEIYTQLVKHYLMQDIDRYETEKGVTADDALNLYLENRALIERKDFLAGEDYKKLVSLENSWEEYSEDYDEWLSKYNAWLDATSSTKEEQKPYATVKLTGAGDDIEKTTQNTELDKWNLIEFYIQGNQLSDRSLTLELWFGEGTATDYTTLMMGGAIFDNAEVAEYTKEEAMATGEVFTVLNKLDDAVQLNSIGGLADTSLDKFEEKWELATAGEDVSKDDISSILLNRANLEDAENFDLEKLKQDTGISDFYELILNNAIPTASTLTNKEYLEIKPNTAYRIAMLVRTEGIKESLGAEIQLLGGEDKDDLSSSVSSAKTINDEEWQEVVFYVLGDTLKKNYVSLKVVMGSGTRFDTSSYIEGKIVISLINIIEIKYSEFSSSSKSGDITNSYTFSNSTAPSNVITNGNFANIDLESTDKKEFNSEGQLTNASAATTKSWTEGTTKNNIYTTPDIDKDSGKISWEKVWGVSESGDVLEPSYYEIWVRYKSETDKYTEEFLTAISAPNGDEDVSFEIPKLKDTVANYKVRAVGKSKTSLNYYDVVSNFSNYSGEVQKDSAGVLLKDYVNSAEPSGYDEQKCKAGTFVFDKASDFAADTGNYVSPFDTGLKITSNYGVVKTMTSSSSTLDSNSYYRVGVWVKTIGEAKASVTLQNVNKILRSTVSTKFIGFTDINTGDKWVEYVFYIEVGNTSGSLTAELSLGNPYLTKNSKKNDKVTSDVTVYETAGLSSGTVLFDNVQLVKIEEEEYNNANEKEQIDSNNDNILYEFKLSDINSSYKDNDFQLYTNKYALRILECTVDSFDSFTENTTTGDGENLGATPKNYSWSKAEDAVGTDEDSRMYGVYSQNDDTEKLKTIYINEEKENTFAGISDLPDDFDIRKFIKIDGNNSLVMSNKVLFGQTYTVSSTSTINAKSYYKLTFKAKTLLAKQAFDSDGNAILDDDDNITYTMEKANAEFRFMQNNTTDEYQSVLINSKNRAESIYDAVEYTMYIYNPSESSSTANWSFVLGADEDEEDATGTKQMLIGAMVIDQVSIVEIDEEDFLTAKEEIDYDNYTDDEKLTSIVKFYEYDEDEPTETDDNDDTDDTDTDDTKTSIWDRGDAWLLISSLVIGGVIIVVIVVLLVRRWKKKHPKEVVGENKLKAEEIKVIENKPTDVLNIKEDDEYSDEVKPTYVQRKVDKGSKSKRKKK